ncbi:MAG: glycine cleavage system H protein [Thermodesulfobacteriota bacterium]
MPVPHGRLYSQDHLWVLMVGTEAQIGLTDHAVRELGQVDYLELPAPGDALVKDEPFGTVETSKAVTDLIAPISGKVVTINEALTDSPGELAEDPYGKGWLLKLEPSDPEELGVLLSPADYDMLIAIPNE